MPTLQPERSSTQSVRALSTGESEFYAITKGTAHSSHSRAILKGFGVPRPIGRECWHWDRIEAGMWTSEASYIQVALVGAGESLKKHSTETNIADLATKYLSHPHMEMLLAAENFVLVSGERGRNGECMLMDSEVNRLLFIVALFLCVGGMSTGVRYYVHAESNASCVTALRVSTMSTGWTRGSRSLELEMDFGKCVWNLGGVTASGDLRLSVFGRETRLSVTS